MGIEKAIGGVVGGVLGGFGGSKKSGSATQTSVQNSEPWIHQQPYLRDVFAKALRAQENPYQGAMLSPGATNQLQDTIDGKFLDPSSNPFLGAYVNDALGLVKSNFAGQYGGQAGSNLGNSGYQEMLTRTLANTALPIYSNAYNQERQNQLQASGLASSVDKANQLSPFTPLLGYQQLIGGNYGGTSQGASSQPFFTNPAAGVLGGALAGSQIGGLFGTGGSTPPIAPPFSSLGGYFG